MDRAEWWSGLSEKQRLPQASGAAFGTCSLMCQEVMDHPCLRLSEPTYQTTFRGEIRYMEKKIRFLLRHVGHWKCKLNLATKKVMLRQPSENHRLPGKLAQSVLHSLKHLIISGVTVHQMFGLGFLSAHYFQVYPKVSELARYRHTKFSPCSDYY